MGRNWICRNWKEKLLQAWKLKAKNCGKGSCRNLRSRLRPNRGRLFIRRSIMLSCIPLSFRMQTGSLESWIKISVRQRVLPIIPSFLCGILTGHYIPYSIWCNGISMPISSTRCWPIMTRVSNICCRSGRFMATKPGVWSDIMLYRWLPMPSWKMWRDSIMNGLTRRWRLRRLIPTMIVCRNIPS